MDPAKALPRCPPPWLVLKEVVRHSFSGSTTFHLSVSAAPLPELTEQANVGLSMPPHLSRWSLFSQSWYALVPDVGKQAYNLWPERNFNLARRIAAKGIKFGKGVAFVHVEAKLDLSETDLDAWSSLLSK